MKKLILALAAIAAVGAGCAKDRTLEEWCQEKFDEGTARISAVSGLYSGTLLSNDNQSALGDFSVMITPGTKPGDMKNCTGSQLQPVAHGRVTFLQGNEKIASFNDGSYNPSNGTFGATISIPQKNLATETLYLTGAVKDGIFTGSLQSDRYPEAGGNFTLSRTGPAKPSLPAAVSSAINSGATTQPDASAAYDGTVKTSSGVSKNAQMIILFDVGDSDQDFLYSFLSSRVVDVTISTGAGQQVNFPGAKWDLRTNRLTGQSSGEVPLTSGPGGGVDRYEVKLDCVAVSPGTRDAGWSCNYYSSQYGLLMTGAFAPRRSGS